MKLSGFLIRFQPQAWIKDWAVDVDPEGETEWYASEDYVTEMKARVDRAGGSLWQQALMMNRDVSDEWRDDPAAPEWVREWHGPFYCEVIENPEEGE